MKHKELREFIRLANKAKLSPTEKDCFLYYYSKTRNPQNMWKCRDDETAEAIGRTRSAVCKARNALLNRNWISEPRFFVIKVVFNDFLETTTVPFETTTVPFETTTVPFETTTVPFGTTTVPNGTPLKDKFKSLKEDEKGERIPSSHSTANDVPEKSAQNVHALFENKYIQEFWKFFPEQNLTKEQMSYIAENVDEMYLWTESLTIWQIDGHRPESVWKLCDKFKNLKFPKKSFAAKAGSSPVAKIRAENAAFASVSEVYIPTAEDYRERLENLTPFDCKKCLSFGYELDENFDRTGRYCFECERGEKLKKLL